MLYPIPTKQNDLLIAITHDQCSISLAPMPAHYDLPLTGYIFEASYSKSAMWANKI